MKNRLTTAIIISVLICPITLCGTYLVEWVNHEIVLKGWLDADLRRLDFFGIYSSVGEDKLREALLIALPPGTPEEEVKAFYLANKEDDHGGWRPEKYSDENSAVLIVYASTRGHGHFLDRLLGSRIVIIFHLNPIDNSLKDITIKVWGLDL